MGFLTGFATGFLKQVNRGYDAQRKAKYEDDRMRAQLVANIAANVAQELPGKMAEYRDLIGKVDSNARVWGSTAAVNAYNTGDDTAGTMNKFDKSESPDELAKIKQQIEARRNMLVDNARGFITAALGDKAPPELNRMFDNFMLPGQAQGQQMQPIVEPTAGAQPEPTVQQPGVDNGYAEPDPTGGQNVLPTEKFINQEIGTILAGGVDDKELMQQSPITGDWIIRDPSLRRIRSKLFTLSQKMYEDKIANLPAGRTMQSVGTADILNTIDDLYHTLLFGFAARFADTDSEESMPWLNPLNTWADKEHEESFKRMYATGDPDAIADLGRAIKPYLVINDPTGEKGARKYMADDLDVEDYLGYLAGGQ